MRTLVASTALAAALVTPLAAPSAHAEDANADHSPCVANRESNSIYVQTRQALEKRWEVAGLGRPRQTPMYGTVVAYPWCGHAMRKAWVGIQYARRGDNTLALGIVVYKASDDEAEPAVTQTDPPIDPPTLIICDGSCT